MNRPDSMQREAPRPQQGQGWLSVGLTVLVAWALATFSGLTSHPLVPVDETRYAAVAWEMWARGDFLVPYFNGAPYSHKPPLLFWLMHALWWVFGVGEPVLRMVSPLLTLVDLALCAWLARLLWPQQQDIARQAPVILLSCAFLTGYLAWVQFDLLLVAGVLLGLCGVALAGRGRPAGWLVAGMGIGTGLLAKGPVVLLHVLPLTWLAPLWLARAARPRWSAWYAGSAISILVGAAMVLAWAIPAAQAGGEAYRDAIFWGQTADRVVHSFAHARPAWWYLPWLPVLFLPWVLLPWLGTALRAGWRQYDPGMRFCVLWLLLTVLLLSLISGKQVKYLLPALPAFALLVGRALAALPDSPVRQRPWSLSAVVALLGVAGMVAPYQLKAAPWLNQVSPLWGALLLALGVGYLLLPPARPRQYPLRMLLLSLAAIVICATGVLRVGAPYYDLKQASRIIAGLQAAGHPVAVTDSYHGQFGFYGRLVQPVEEIDRARSRDWAGRHPEGFLVMKEKKQRVDVPGVCFEQPYKGGYLAIVAATPRDTDATGRQPEDCLARAGRSGG